VTAIRDPTELDRGHANMKKGFAAGQTTAHRVRFTDHAVQQKGDAIIAPTPRQPLMLATTGR